MHDSILSWGRIHPPTPLADHEQHVTAGVSIILGAEAVMVDVLAADVTAVDVTALVADIALTAADVAADVAAAAKVVVAATDVAADVAAEVMADDVVVVAAGIFSSDNSTCHGCKSLSLAR